MAEQSQDKPTKRERDRVERLAVIAEDIRSNDLEHKRTEALVTARAIALAGLPKRRSSAGELSRTLRLGENLWLRVIYQTVAGSTLPYGQDRFVLAGIQHLALQLRSPVVYFKHVSELLKMFDLSTDGRSLQRLRERFERLAKLSIRLHFAESESGLHRAVHGESIFIIKRFALPTRKELREELRVTPIRERQLELPGLALNEDAERYGVLLSSDFWEHLKEPQNHLILRLDVMQHFVNQPTGWDYATFLMYRCSRAQTWSPVPHEVLMSLFQDNPKDQDSKTVDRLRKYHDQVMTATDGKLKAELRPAGQSKTGKRGRPKERWELWVGPSQQIVWSGKKDALVPALEGGTPTNVQPGLK